MKAEGGRRKILAGATLTAAALGVASIALAAGSAPGIEANVDRDQVALGDTFVYSLTIVSDVDSQPSQLRLPDFKGFSDMGRSQSEQISLSFGSGGRGFLRTKTVRATLSPNKTGTLEIGPATAVIKGKRYEAQRIAISVLPAGKGPVQRPQRPGTTRYPSMWDDDFDVDSVLTRPKTVGKDEIVLRAGVDKVSAYVGEQVVWVLQLYSRVPLSGLDSLSMPKFEGFWTEDITSPQRYTSETKVVGGVQYNVYLLKRKGLFPTKPGRLAIEAASAQVSYGTSVFTPGQRANRQSEAQEIEVKALPESGRPPGFNPGNVGQFTLRTEVSAHTTRLDQPITVRFVVNGTGNVKYVQIPRLSPGDDFKAYDPTVSEKVNTTKHRFSGERQWEYLLIPQKVGKAIIPEVALHFFDPASGQYQSLSSGPIAVEVTPGTGESATVSGKAAAKGPTVQAGVRPIRYNSRLEAMDPAWHRSWPVKAVFVLFPLAFIGVIGYGRILAFVRRETPYSKQKRAHAQAFRRLKAAARMLKAGREAKAEEFFAEIARVLREYLTYRLGREAAGLTVDQVRDLMREAGVDEVLSARVIQEVENCDFARFAPSATRREEMERSLERTRELLVELEKKG
ncbi:MAG: BatD family protein [Deltaproteobacteria bacterium]|nr:BatD family protein [Deltaproteobacteria bacterium]